MAGGCQIRTHLRGIGLSFIKVFFKEILLISFKSLTRKMMMMRNMSVTIQGTNNKCLCNIAPSKSNNDNNKWSTAALITPNNAASWWVFRMLKYEIATSNTWNQCKFGFIFVLWMLMMLSGRLEFDRVLASANESSECLKDDQT